MVAAQLWGDMRVRPSLTADLVHTEEAVRMVEQEPEELELPPGEGGFLSLVAYHTALGIQPETLEIPDVPVPQVEPPLVALHLSLDYGVVLSRGFLCAWEHLGQPAPDTIEQYQLEVK